MNSLFDAHSRPLPRFYDLTIERRAEAIWMERNQVAIRRMRVNKQDFFLEAKRLADLDDSVALLDLVNEKKSRVIYQRILMGEYHV